MSLPKSKILSVSRGFAAAAEVYNNSPNQTQILNVNIKSPDNEQSERTEQTKQEEVLEPKPQIETVKNLSETAKDNIISAYALLLSIVESNPLIQNKYIIAKCSNLAQLIQLLTEADSVEINKSNDVSCSCFDSATYSAVEKIYVIKNDETFNFKYSFPEVNKLLDEHRISVKFVVD